MKDLYASCRKCGSELLFIREPESSPHAFRAVCSKCKNKKGEKLFEAWVSWDQIELIAKTYPDTKIIPDRPFTESEIKVAQLRAFLRELRDERKKN